MDVSAENLSKGRVPKIGSLILSWILSIEWYVLSMSSMILAAPSPNKELATNPNNKLRRTFGEIGSRSWVGAWINSQGSSVWATSICNCSRLAKNLVKLSFASCKFRWISVYCLDKTGSCSNFICNCCSACVSCWLSTSTFRIRTAAWAILVFKIRFASALIIGKRLSLLSCKVWITGLSPWNLANSPDIWVSNWRCWAINCW